MKLFLSWLVFLALALAGCFVVMGVAYLVFAVPNWQLTAVGLWIVVCFASLMVPERFFDRKKR